MLSILSIPLRGYNLYLWGISNRQEKSFFLSGPFFAQITKSISEDIEKEEEDGPRKRPARFLEDDEGLEVGLYVNFVVLLSLSVMSQSVLTYNREGSGRWQEFLCCAEDPEEFEWEDCTVECSYWWCVSTVAIWGWVWKPEWNHCRAWISCLMDPEGGRKSYLILTAVWCAATLASLSIVVEQWAQKRWHTPHGYRFFC